MGGRGRPAAQRGALLPVPLTAVTVLLAHTPSAAQHAQRAKHAQRAQRSPSSSMGTPNRARNSMQLEWPCSKEGCRRAQSM